MSKAMTLFLGACVCAVAVLLIPACFHDPSALRVGATALLLVVGLAMLGAARQAGD